LFFLAIHHVTVHSITVRRIPGSNPATNSAPMEVLVATA